MAILQPSDPLTAKPDKHRHRQAKNRKYLLKNNFFIAPFPINIVAYTYLTLFLVVLTLYFLTVLNSMVREVIHISFTHE